MDTWQADGTPHIEASRDARLEPLATAVQPEMHAPARTAAAATAEFSLAAPRDHVELCVGGIAGGSPAYEVVRRAASDPQQPSSGRGGLPGSCTGTMQS